MLPLRWPLPIVPDTLVSGDQEIPFALHLCRKRHRSLLQSNLHRGARALKVSVEIDTTRRMLTESYIQGRSTVLARIQGLVGKQGAVHDSPNAKPPPRPSGPTTAKQPSQRAAQALKIKIVTWNMHDSLPKVRCTWTASLRAAMNNLAGES